MNNKNIIPNIRNEISPFQLVILALSLYVLVALFFQLVNKPSPPISKLLDFFDFIVCIVFIFDFFYRFYKSENKLAFLKWGWIDLISSIPTINFLRWGRLFRLFKLFRLLRAFRSTKNLISFVYKYRARCSLAAAAIITFLLILFSSIAILTFEDNSASHIKTPIDALWWAFSTISTTGSGDAYPVTTEGKVLSIVLAIAGIGLFGTFTAFVAKLFLEPSEKNESDRIRNLEKQVEKLNSQIEKLIAHNSKEQIEDSIPGGKENG